MCRVQIFCTKLYFAIKNSPNWTKSETGVRVNYNKINDLYEKIIDINCSKVYSLIEKFKLVAYGLGYLILIF